MVQKRTVSKVLHATTAAIASLLLGLFFFLICRYTFGLFGSFVVAVFELFTQNKTSWFNIGYQKGVQLGSFVGAVSGAFVAFHTFRFLISVASRWLYLAAIIIVPPICLFWFGLIAPFMLNIAIREHNVAQVHLLMMLGGNVDKSAVRDNLETATRLGDKEIVSLLIAKGTKVHQEALCQAISSRKSDIVEILIDKGASINGVDQRGRTPLICAIHAESGAIVKLLLAKGADANINHPLNEAILKRRIDIASQLLANGANVNIGTRSSEIPLHIAAKTGQFDLIRLLIQYGADVNYKSTLPNVPGTTQGVGLRALDVAIQANQIDAVRALMGTAPSQF